MKSKKPASSVNPQDDIKQAPKAADLAKVVAKATAMIDLESEIAVAEDRVKELSQKLTAIATVELPELMTELGLKDFSLSNGSKVTIKPIVSASIPTEVNILKMRDLDEQSAARLKFEQALSYLEKNGAGALIKNMVVAELGKDSIKLSKQAIAALAKLKIAAVATRGVHGATLTAWVKERLTSGKGVDHDILSVYEGQKAEIVVPRDGSKKIKGSIF